MKTSGKYIYNTKRLEEGLLKVCLHCRPKSSEIRGCSGWCLVDGGYNGEIFIQEEEIIVRN